MIIKKVQSSHYCTSFDHSDVQFFVLLFTIATGEYHLLMKTSVFVSYISILFLTISLPCVQLRKISSTILNSGFIQLHDVVYFNVIFTGILLHNAL